MKRKIWAAAVAVAVALSSAAIIPYGGLQNVVAARPSGGNAEVTDTSTDGRTTTNGFRFSITGTEATITGYTGTAKELAIPTKITVTRTDTTPPTVTTPGGVTQRPSQGTTNNNTTSVDYAVVAVADDAFSGNLGIQTVTMAGGTDSTGKVFGIRSVGDRAFFACHDLTTITFASTTTSIGKNALADCVALNSITVSEGNIRYKVVDGALYHYTAGAGTGLYTLEQYPLGNSATEYKVPESVAGTLVEIGEGAFWGSRFLETINLPAMVKTVGESAFSECKKLKKVTLPAGLSSLGAEAFKGCSALEEVTLPDGIKMINNATFQYCEALKKVNMPDTLTLIGNRAFQGCKAMTEFTVPGSVTMIGDQAFAQCENLRQITIPMKTTSIGSGVFTGTRTSILCHNGSQAAIYAGNNGLTTERTYTVAFYTNNTYTTIVSSQEVVEGKDAVPPEVAERDGYKMSWSGNYTSIRQDTRVYQIWKKLFDVTFIDTYNDKKEVVKVEDGGAPVPPDWSMSGYTLSWDDELPTEVVNNLTYHAVWRNNSTGKVIGPDVVKPQKKGTELKKGNFLYKVNSANAQNPSVKLIGLENAEVTNVVIPETVSIGGVRYQVTAISVKALNGNEKVQSLVINKYVKSISAKAFFNCKKLKKVKIKSKSMTKINNKAFANIHEKAVFYTYESQKSKFKAMLKNAGVKKPTIKRL